MTNVCHHCHMKVESSEAKVGDKCFHTSCFVCSNCKEYLLNTPFRMRENVLYCEKCFHNRTAVICAECKHPIKGNNRIEAMGQFYHPRHFVCFNCKGRLVKGFFQKKMISVDGQMRNCGFCPFCEDEMEMMNCPKCNKPLNDSLVFDGTNYMHMDCESALERKSNYGKGIYKPTDLSSSSASLTASESHTETDSEKPRSLLSKKSQTSDSESTDLSFTRIPVIEPISTTTVINNSIANHPTHIPVESFYVPPKEKQYRPADFSSDPRDHMHGFESQGNVVNRGNELTKKKEFVSDGPDMSDFESQGSVIERSAVYGKKEEPEIVDREDRYENFTSNGDIRNRATIFETQASLTVIDEDEDEDDLPKEKDLHGFVSQGSIRDRATMFGKPKDSLPVIEEEETLPKEHSGFRSQGSIRDRLSMFQGGSNTNSAENKQDSNDH